MKKTTRSKKKTTTKQKKSFKNLNKGPDVQRTMGEKIWIIDASEEFW